MRSRHPAIVAFVLTLFPLVASAEPRPVRHYVGIGFGWGGVRASGTSNRGVPVALQTGYRISCQLHLVIELDAMIGAFDMTGSDRTVELTSTRIGVRWGPESFEEHELVYPDPRAFHLKAGLGIGSLHAFPDDSLSPFDGDRLDTGLQLGAAIGWLPIRARGYALGLEAFEQATFFSERTVHSFGVLLLAQLRIR